MRIDINKNGTMYYGINENDAFNLGLEIEYKKGIGKFILDEVRNNRQMAYNTESDPLFLEWQYDQTSEKEQAWRDKVAEIKTRYPLPTKE
ncbi:hypothetical protein ACSWVZ_002593 [Photobacterium damselae]